MLRRTPGSGTSWRERGPYVVLALVAYVPVLLTQPGVLAADTKAYLFINPGDLLARAGYLWDPNVAMGTVTHQNIGYLFPLGPLFWLIEQLPVPMWVGQRVWIGTTLFAAGAGFVWLARRLSLTGWAVLAGALVYQLSPYTLAYLGRTTVILLPWAALPWLIGLARRSLLEGGWRAPAWFALVVTLVGGTNASSLLFIGLAPVLWFPFAVWVTREGSLREAVAAMARIGALLVPTQLWWVAGLSLQAAYGLPILELTETVETVAETSTAAEIVRGLGYWYFYGRDGLEPWTEAARFYTQNLAIILVSFTLPAIAAVSGFATRWRYRSYAVALILLGATIGIGTHPYHEPPPVASAIKSAADLSAAGMALRNSPRAVPLLVLGAALLVTAGLVALGAAVERWRGGRHRLLAPLATALVAVLAVVNMPPLWTGGVVQSNLEYPEDLPDHWEDALDAVDDRDDGTRVLEIPGMDFGTYRWGNTQDVISPGLLDRPWVGRQLIPFGTPASADLIRAWDRRLQEGTFEPSALGPFARLVGAGDVLLRSDTQYERYRSPRPRALWQRLADGAPGLGAPVAFGPTTPNRAVPEQPMIDETELALDPDHPHPPPVALYDVDGARPEVRADTEVSTIVSGDGDGIVDMAAAGLLPEGTFVYAATFADDPERLVDLAEREARLVLTDTNRRRGQRWGTLRENDGYTEQPGEEPLVDDPSDTRLDVFPEAGDEWFTTVDLRGVASVRASRYGNPVSFTPEDRPAGAVDGDLATAWKVGAFDEVRGERIVIELDEPTPIDHLVLVQPLDGPNRWITEVEVRVDDGDPRTVALTDESRTPEGQRVDLPPATATTVSLTITDSNIVPLVNHAGFSPVGFAEIRIPGVAVDEVVEVSSALLDAVGDAATAAPLDIVLTRLRANPSEPFRRDPEPRLARSVELAGPRSSQLTGTARLHANAPGEVIDELVGLGRDVTGLTVRTSDHLSGAIHLRGSSAVDGDPTTAWNPGYTGQVGRWIEVDSESPLTVDRLDLEVVADGRHSVPTRLLVEVDGTGVEVPVPPVEDGTEENHTVSVPVEMPTTLTGNVVRVTVVEVREQTTTDYFSFSPLVMPIGIAELGIPGATLPDAPDELPDECRGDLVELDGRPVPVRIRGSVSDAVAREGLDVTPCTDEPLALAGPVVEVRTAPGRATGIDVDRLVLRSPGAETAPALPGDPPAVTVVEESRLGREIDVSGIDGPFWLVFGQSHSRGWEASSSELGDLGEPVLVDGYANGWYVDPPDGVGGATVTIRWTPQRRVWFGVGISLLGLALCAGILLVARRRPPAPAGIVAEPRLWNPLRSGGARPPRVTLVASAVGLGVAGGLLGGTWVGLSIGVLSGVALLHDRGRAALSLPGALVLGPVAAFVALQQLRHEFPIGVEWPTAFDPAKWFVLVGLLALGADVVVGMVRRRAAGERAGDPEDDAPAPLESLP